MYFKGEKVFYISQKTNVKRLDIKVIMLLYINDEITIFERKKHISFIIFFLLWLLPLLYVYVRLYNNHESITSSFLSLFM